MSDFLVSTAVQSIGASAAAASDFLFSYTRVSWMSTVFVAMCSSAYLAQCLQLPCRGLDMSRFCVNSKASGPQLYDLFAVVNHHGGIFGGHYTSYVRLPKLDNSTEDEVGRLVARVISLPQLSLLRADTVRLKPRFVLRQTSVEMNLARDIERLPARNS